MIRLNKEQVALARDNIINSDVDKLHHYLMDPMGASLFTLTTVDGQVREILHIGFRKTRKHRNYTKA